jgi:hypothetical protein
MKTLLCTLILATLGTVVAKADTITIALDQQDQTIAAGDTIEFFGTMTNDSANTIYLNADDLNLNGLSLTTTDQFYNNVPIALAPSGQAGDSSSDIELFDVTASSPLLDAPGTYTGTYTLIGGTDGNAQNNLGTANFSVTTLAPVPEPSTIYLLLTGALAMMVPIWRRMRLPASSQETCAL